MPRRLVTLALVAALAVSLVTLTKAVRLPGNNQGYEPVQPIAYSHRLHAGELQIACVYCHFASESSRHAGIPPVNVCMNCHQSVSATAAAVKQEEERAAQANDTPKTIISPELRKLYDAQGLDDTLVPIEGRTPKPVEWIRVHSLPDFVYFDHRAHVSVGVTCQTCHGPIETMERVQQFGTLAMGWCVNCHREAAKTGVNGKPVHPSTDCVTCHY